MPEPYAPEPEYSYRDYEKAKKLLATGGVPPDKVGIVQTRIAEYEKADAEKTQALGYTQSSSVGAAKDALVAKVRRVARDDSLPNASGLKAFGDKTEYEPAVKANPFNPLMPMGAQERTIWQEPTVKDFRAALAANEALRSKAQAEMSAGAYEASPDVAEVSPNAHAPLKVRGIEDYGSGTASVEQIDDPQLEQSEAFKAYRDAAWAHALADAVAKNRPIYRAAFTNKLSDAEKQIASIQDKGGSFVGGLGQGATMGLLDPLKRAINPSLAAEDRRQRNRNPNYEMAGELSGSMVGAPNALARGSAKLLERALGKSTLGRAAASTGAGAITGGVEAQTRAVAQLAADAIDASDSATEALAKVYESLSLAPGLQGALIGGGVGLGTHVLGSGANSAGKKIVTSGEGDTGRGAVVKQNLETGGKMDWAGQIKTEPEIENLTHRAPADVPADEILARRIAKPMAETRRLEQEAAAREADAATSAARERLGGQTVPVEDTAARLDKYADGLVDDTAASEVRKVARKLRKASLLSPKELDDYIDMVDQKAGYDSGKKLDKKRSHFVEMGKILREERDTLQYDEPTNPGGFKLRDSRGNVKTNSDYSAMKTELSERQHKFNEENERLGLPMEVKVGPQPATAGDNPPNVRLSPTEDDKFVRGIQGAGSPGKSIQTKAQERLAGKSGVAKEYALIKKMRARGDYRKMLGQAMHGISAGPNGISNKYLSSNQLLRLVPALKSFGGGLEVEATDELVDLLDRYLEEQAGRGREALGNRVMRDMVPEAKALNLRGGQPAKLLGSARRDEKGDSAPLTPEERALVGALVKKLTEINK